MRRAGTQLRPADTGSAVIEFVVMAVGVLVPVAYLVLAAAGVQAAAFASTQAVREAGRAFSTAETVAAGRQRAEAAARLAFADHGLVLPADALRVRCLRGECLSPGSAVEIEVSWSVPLPWLPGSVGDDGPARIPLSAVSLVPVDDYRSSPGGAP